MDLATRIDKIEAGYRWHLAASPRAARMVDAVRLHTRALAEGFSALLVPTGAALLAHSLLSTKNRKTARFAGFDPDPGLCAALAGQGRHVTAFVVGRDPRRYEGLDGVEVVPLPLTAAVEAAHREAFDLVVVDTFGFLGRLVPLLARAHLLAKSRGAVWTLIHPGVRPSWPTLVERAGAETTGEDHERVPRLLRAGRLADAQWDVMKTQRRKGATVLFDAGQQMSERTQRDFDPPQPMRAFFDTAPVADANAQQLQDIFARFAARRGLSVVHEYRRSLDKQEIVYVSLSDGSIGAVTFARDQNTVATTRTPSSVEELYELAECATEAVGPAPLFFEI